MKLSRLELFGFKSFPRRTIITFDDGITGIVGPNGSGKSNIADAMRWVLGEQSAKALRGAKMEDVIFAGTQTRKMMPYCEVSLIFDNADGTLNDPHSEVMVTRRVYRSGEGEYSLNKKQCRLKDILGLFRDTGIGQEGYSLIGQGHIDEILSNKGEERRAAFEEAAGIAAFRSRKEEALRKLQRTEDNLARVMDLVEELSGRLIPLKEQAQAAQQYILNAERLKLLDINIFLWRHDRLEERMSTLEEKVAGMKALIARHEKDLLLLKAKRNELDAELTNQEAISDRAKEVLAELETDWQEHRLLSQRRIDELEMAQEDFSRLNQAVDKFLEEYLELKALAEKSQEEESQVSARLQSLSHTWEQEEAFLGQKSSAVATAEEALEAHRSRILKSAGSLSGARENRVRQQMMLDQATKRRDELQAERAVLEKAQDNQAGQLDAAKGRHEDAKRMMEGLFAELAKKEKEARSGHERYQEMMRDLGTLKSKIRQDESRHDTLRELSQGLEGYFQPVRQALKYARQMPKVRGVLAQLVTVPREMETAIEMLLGNTLQNIVTDDEETAQRLIDYLRENKLGRTTFLPISAISPKTLSGQERRLLDMPGCLGVASDLVDTNDVFRPIVENLLGRAIVVRTLSDAIPISRAGRQSFHVVTLQGDVMRAGGAITGGASATRSASFLGREREIKELSASILREQAVVARLAQEADATLKKLQEEDSSVAAIQAKAQDEEIGLAREEERVRNAQTALNNAKQKLDAVQGAIAQLETTIIDLQQDLSRTDNEAQAMETDQKLLAQQEIELKTALASLRQEMDLQREKTAAALAARQELSHQINFLMHDRNRLNKELSRIRSQQEKAKGDQQKLEERIEALTLSQEEDALRNISLQGRLASARDEMAGLDQKRRQIQQAQKQCSEEMEVLHQRLQEDSAKLHRSELSLTRLQDEQHALASTLWNSYELTYSAADVMRGNLSLDLPGAENEAAQLRQTIRDMGPVNIHAIEDYAQTRARYDGLTAQQKDANKAREDLNQLIERLQKEMEKQFVTAFELLNTHFGETFKRLFSGGQARLSLSDPGDPLGCDILIEAQPPGKKLQLLSLLSGGERALTAIAILFAMLELKATPFCVLDEIEAALDDANIVHFADYLAEYAKETQFIVVTHRKGTMARCDTLYGVTMREKGVSDMISVSLQNYPA